MNTAQQRDIAASATRSEMRKYDQDPMDVDGDYALMVLSDISRAEPDLIASIWYRNASPLAETLFIREWNARRRRQATTLIVSGPIEPKNVNSTEAKP